jgi:hypothetical protein
VVVVYDVVTVLVVDVDVVVIVDVAHGTPNRRKG